LPTNGIQTGPTLCKTVGGGNNAPDPFLCSQPSQANSLHISKISANRAVIKATPSTLTLIANSGTPAFLTITNNSANIAALNVRAVLPASWTDVSQDASDCLLLAAGASCQLQFTPGANTHAIANISIAGSNTTQVSVKMAVVAPNQAIIDFSSPRIMLATQGIFTNASGTGVVASKARVLTINNSGSAAAEDVNYTISPALPTGTTISPVSCGTIPAGAPCTLLITPGSTASSPADSEPVPSVITVTSSNTAPITGNIVLLTYGNRYQEGFVFSIDDNTPITQSVGGKVAALSDHITPADTVFWSSNSTGGYDGGISIWGIDQLSAESFPSPNGSSAQPATLISGQANCMGRSDGSCNTGNIVVYYSAPNISPEINRQFYAAGRCKLDFDGHNDWYLPAICEMGYGGIGSGSGCGVVATPTIQNMTSNLVDNGIGTLIGDYWSSTEVEGNSATDSWFQVFSSTLPEQGQGQKLNLFKIRCVRAITPIV